MRTHALVALGLAACGSGARQDPTPPIEAAAAPPVVAPPPANAPAPITSAIFTCTRYQTFCGGIDRYVSVCRASDVSATVIVPTEMFENRRLVVATFTPASVRTQTIHVRSCSGEFTVDVKVDAELLDFERAEDLENAQVMLARRRSAP